MVTEHQADNLYKWQQARRRNGRPTGGVATQGFGPKGEYTLWLPPSGGKPTYTFENGRSVRQLPDVALNTPEMLELRGRVLRSFTSVGPGLLECDVAFLDYAAAVLLINYAFDDGDLAMVLSGNKWQAAMVRHLVGGERFAAELEQFAAWRSVLVTGGGLATPRQPLEIPPLEVLNLKGFEDPAPPLVRPRSNLPAWLRRLIPL